MFGVKILLHISLMFYKFSDIIKSPVGLRFEIPNQSVIHTKLTTTKLDIGLLNDAFQVFLLSDDIPNHRIFP
jgi:hypothetical protein